MHEQAIGESTTFTLEVVLQLLTLAFVLGGIYFHFKDTRRRLANLEKHAVRKHWFRNFWHLFMGRNPRLNQVDPDEIKSQE
jgi:hypothetical protein